MHDHAQSLQFYGFVEKTNQPNELTICYSQKEAQFQQVVKMKVKHINCFKKRKNKYKLLNVKCFMFIHYFCTLNSLYFNTLAGDY